MAARRAAVKAYELEFYEDDDGNSVVLDWLRSLSLTKKKVLGTAMRQVLQQFGADVCRSEYGKHLGQGLFEFRVRQKPGDVGTSRGKKLPPEAILLRVFCHAHGEKLVLLLGGYDKAEDVSKKRQSKEIAEARARLKLWKARQ